MREYQASHEAGTYRRAACGNEPFESGAKFDPGCGWPSFYEPAEGRHRQDGSGHEPRHGLDRGPVLGLRLAPRPSLRGRPAPERVCSSASTRPCRTWRGSQAAVTSLRDAESLYEKNYIP